MQWEELTAPEFAKAVKDTGGVCLLAAGCMEQHYHHLPLGMDYLNGHKVCCLAAEIEPAVVFPHYFLGQINEGKSFPGAVAIDPILTVQLLRNVCDEIGRNGFRKIIIWNAHGGNASLLNYVCRTLQAERKPYAIYLPTKLYPEDREKQWDQITESDVDLHGGEFETSMCLANYPELVKMDALKGAKAPPRGRLHHMPPGAISARFYAEYPEHYGGDATVASAEKGEKFVKLLVDSLADIIRAVKEDNAVLENMKEFYDRCDEVANS